MEFLIISGMSGAGKSLSASTLEDLGYYCVDNMPVEFIPKFAALCKEGGKRYEKVALVTDVRGVNNFEKLYGVLEELKRDSVKYEILFLEASEETIIKRYKETRHTHPLAEIGDSISDAVQKEKNMLGGIRSRADHVLDTSNMSNARLRGELIRLFGPEDAEKAMTVSVISFGYKYGIPLEADLVFDVRFLANPYYVPQLKELTGLSKEIRDYVFAGAQTSEFLHRLEDMLTYLLPLYFEEGKASLVIAIGCTGGKHRSVCIAKYVADFISDLGYKVKESHRDVSRA